MDNDTFHFFPGPENDDDWDYDWDEERDSVKHIEQEQKDESIN